MGSPLAPVLANIFMGFHESKWLNEYNLNKPKFYLRYVHDILAPFENEQDSLNSLNVLNNSHSNIKFKIEKQINHSIAFLDAFISGINNQNLTQKHITSKTYDIENIKSILIKNAHPPFSFLILIIKNYLNIRFLVTRIN